MNTITDPRIAPPAFHDVLEKLVGLVQAFPDRVTPQQYVTWVEGEDYGHPCDLVGSALSDLGAPIMQATWGNREHHDLRKAAQGIPGVPWAKVRFPILWNRLFTSKLLDGSPTPYDHFSTMFWGMQRDAKVAEAYLVYALLDHVVSHHHVRNPRSQEWRDLLDAGLRSFRRFLLSDSSGFLVQVRTVGQDGKYQVPPAGHFAYRLLEKADTLTAAALKEIARA